MSHPNVAGSAGETVGSRYKLPGSDSPEGAPATLLMILSYSVVSLSVDCKFNTFKPNPGHYAFPV